MVWHESLSVSQVAALELSQLQIYYVGPYLIVIKPCTHQPAQTMAQTGDISSGTSYLGS